MTNITIRTRGDRRLYESLASDFDSETNHRTEIGAGKRLFEIEREWARATTGVTGSIEIEVNRKVLRGDEALIFERRIKLLADPDWNGF